MLKRIIVNCPREIDKRYFSFLKERYENDLNIYLNNDMLFSHINDAEEYLPLKYSKDLEIDVNKENTIKFEYNISFGPIKEKADVMFILKTNGVITTNIHRHNHVEGSENLDDDYLITFLINEQKTLLDKSYHEGPSKDINFDNYYSYPLSVRWFSRKPFTDTKTIYWDDIELRLE